MADGKQVFIDNTAVKQGVMTEAIVVTMDHFENL